MRRIALALIALTLGGVGVAHGRDCLDVSFPDEVNVERDILVLNGLGVRRATILKVKVYVAALYVAKRATDPNAILEAPTPKRLVLHFVRDVGRTDLNAAWNEGFLANSKEQIPKLEKGIEKLESLMRDMKSGERLTFTHEPSTGIRVDVAGTTAGTVEGDDFAKALLAIWLGPHPPNDELKAGLLGGPCG